MHKLTRLDNGLRVVTAEMPHARSASVAFFFGSGSRCEEKEISGSSHFIEHMLFKGTEQRPTAKDISQAIEGVGGVLNAESGKEVTVYWAKVTMPHLHLALEVITDVVRNSVFAPEEVEKERRVIIEELSMLMDAPQDWVDVLIDEVMWGDQPLGRDGGGTK